MEWVNTFTRDYSVQYCDAVFRAIGSEGKGICSGIRKQLFHPHNKNEGHFIEKQEWNFLIGKLNKLLENNSSLEKEINIFHQKGKEYTGIAFKLNRLDLPNIAGSQLLKIYKEFFLCWRDYTSYLWEMFVLNDVISEKSGELLKQKQRSYEQNQFNEFMNYVSSPSNKSELFVLNDKLRKLKLDYTEDKFLKIWNDYKWLSCLDLHNAPLSKDKMHEYYDNLPEEREKAYANFELSEQEKRLIELNRKFIHIKDARDDYRRKGIFYVQPLFAEVGKRLGLNLKDVSMLTYDEIFSCLSGENKASILQEMIEKRKQGFMLFKNKEKIECVAGSEIRQNAENLSFSIQIQNTNEISGKIGCGGKVKGIVKVIKNTDELGKVETGDVLVSITTGPDYVPAMAKASAFVTDQGGITCHAAIVAREMEKPCIVGTGNATLLLNDGDLVEVDAENGTVKKLSD